MAVLGIRWDGIRWDGIRWYEYFAGIRKVSPGGSPMSSFDIFVKRDSDCKQRFF
jgi:hypothetical protein